MDTDPGGVQPGLEARDEPAREPRGLDLAELKRRQQAAWSTGDFGVIGAKLVIVSETLCEAVDLRAGERVLDVACGHGNTALAAARRSAPAVGVDYVPSLLARARERAAAERLEVEWREGDAEELPVEDGAFDVVLSTFGVMFAPDQPRAAQELLRACRPGGRIGLACWTPDGAVGEMFRTVARHVPPLPGAPSPTRWGTEDGLAELLGDGVSELRAERREFVQRYASVAHWLEVFRTWFGPIRALFAALDEDGQAALARDLEELLRRQDRSGGGSLVVPSEYLEVVATRG
jgi:SAM-dependent methyltransferase